MEVTVWKHVLAIMDLQDIMIPEGAELLTAGSQGDVICVWYRCNPRQDKKPRRIAVCGTGHAAPTPMTGRYIGTAFLNHLGLVFHIFEQIGE